MATVYLARDAKHGRLVAIKDLRPELAAAIGVERFLREIQIAARLNHPHIVTLHDSGEIDGLLYYVMPYVEGESLRQRLERSGPLPVDEAVRLGREVAGALGYAHQQGIVHRDVKPENILLQAGHALVTDFGIARAVTAAGGAELTSSGVAVGTPLYMSPEQVVGDPVDARSDVYSLGCTLYEMLSGAPPYAGASALAVLASHAADPVPSLRQRRGEVPPALERTVSRAMAKLPDQRYASASALDAALASGAAAPPSTPPGRRRRAVAALAILALALAATGYALVARRRQPPEKSIAVLPLVNQSGAQDDQIRSDGMTEALIDALSQVPGLRVASRMSVFAYQNSALDSRAIGARLHATAMLEGSFQRAGSVLQVSVRLINADDGYVLWSDTFRRDQKDVFAVQDEISQAVVRALQVRLGGAARPLVRRSTENLDAYDLYLKGRWFWNQRAAGPASLRRSVGFFEQALALDSNYAAAWPASRTTTACCRRSGTCRRRRLTQRRSSPCSGPSRSTAPFPRRTRPSASSTSSTTGTGRRRSAPSIAPWRSIRPSRGPTSSTPGTTSPKDSSRTPCERSRPRNASTRCRRSSTRGWEPRCTTSTAMTRRPPSCDRRSSSTPPIPAPPRSWAGSWCSSGAFRRHWPCSGSRSIFKRGTWGEAPRATRSAWRDAVRTRWPWGDASSSAATSAISTPRRWPWSPSASETRRARWIG